MVTPRPRTSVTQHRAEFRADPFERPRWQLTEWVEHVTVRQSVSTAARDYLVVGGRELTGVDLPDRTFFDERVDRAFVFTDQPQDRFGLVVCLTERKKP
jgi:hypothetical protein